MEKEYQIERLDHFGRGIASEQGKVFFIENALEKEVVKAKILEEKKSRIEGVACSIEKKSPDRIEAECPYYSLCGGCDVMHMTKEKELSFKQEKTENILAKYAGIPKELIKEIIPTLDLYYRNKITLKVKNGKLGYYAKKSYDLVSIAQCLIADQKINQVLSFLNKLLFKGIQEVVIRSGKEETMVVLSSQEPFDFDYYKEQLKGVTNHLVALVKDRKQVLFGSGYVEEQFGGFTFQISPLSFFQVNSLGAFRLYSLIEKYASLTGKETVLDLYCGTGTIGMFLSPKASRVIGVEINANAIHDARQNIKNNHISNMEFFCQDVKEIRQHFSSIDLVVVDPPRSGLSKQAMEVVLGSNAKKIIYVSCDTFTLARDLTTLKNDYDIQEITPVDMFPNTHHVECVCVLNLR